MVYLVQTIRVMRFRRFGLQGERSSTTYSYYSTVEETH